MRVLYLLLLVPLGALASCPAGLQLSNVPISTTLPYCVKWESSSLGGCEVNCPGVCVEMPNADSKGPIQTTGSECKLGTGGDGGGDTGGDNGGGDAPYDYPFKNQISPIGVGGAYQEGTTAALKQIDEDLRWFAIKNYGQGKEMVATFNAFGKDLMKVTDALTTQSSSFEEYGKTQFSILTTLGRTQDTLQQLTNCVVNPEENNCGHLSGGSSSGGGLGQAYWDSKLGEMIGRMDRGYYGGIQNIDRSTSTAAQYTAEIASQLGGNGVNGHLMDIKEALKSGGSSGGEGGGDIDYSKMPGAAGNPLQVAGAEYESGLCQEGDNCAFNLGNINKQYDDKKEELKDKYKAIKDEVAEIFKFDLSGSGSVPKCFELYSLFGKSYSVCPSVGGYWEALAAIMMFVFYFLALMIVARR